jgi:hypothetical protein
LERRRKTSAGLLTEICAIKTSLCEKIMTPCKKIGAMKRQENTMATHPVAPPRLKNI